MKKLQFHEHWCFAISVILHAVALAVPLARSGFVEKPAGHAMLVVALLPEASMQRDMPVVIPAPQPQASASKPRLVHGVEKKPIVPNASMQRHTPVLMHASHSQTSASRSSMAHKDEENPIKTSTSTGEEMLSTPQATDTAISGVVPSGPALKTVAMPEVPSAINSGTRVGPAPKGHFIEIARPDYAKNPAPDYPALARRYGITGTVLMRVRVTVDGRPDEIVVAQSSKHQVLDDAARMAVAHWRFIPARRGDERLESWVEFPLQFTLTAAR
jgi:protein TonB